MGTIVYKPLNNRGGCQPALPTPGDVLKALCGDSNYIVRSGLARRDDCPQRLLTSWVRLTNIDMLCAIASRDDCTPRRLKMLAQGAGLVRAVVSANPRCPAELIVQAGYNNYSPARSAAAATPRCPADALRRLAVDPSADVRMAAVRNPALPA